MSRSSAAKKARRKKRVGARNDSWLPDEVHAEIKGVARIADVIIPRGWEFDTDFSTDDFVTWYYPPSGIDDDSGDDDVEPVTRIWLTDPDEPHVIVVGSGEDDGDVTLTVEDLFARLDEFEGHRAG
ncbi:hypothetical protein CIW49_01515 [Mycolicibacterium sp. P1-18]|uniref:hypothetical protein n=1 Tax=Mycolicibacterium sp. P1-18 TaxID=2024615 RepID=UPI0011F1DCE8|nr:hypothetical protein [Mycolicibacterium sp. P1-18]KAA0102045.1 hypothetical protein CIW49_01515 [Mycolicibacterium sp. P1-18]